MCWGFSGWGLPVAGGGKPMARNLSATFLQREEARKPQSSKRRRRCQCRNGRQITDRRWLARLGLIWDVWDEWIQRLGTLKHSSYSVS